MLARRLAREIEPELQALQRLGDELRSAPGLDDTFSLRARGSILHDVYTAVERVFVRIAEELNGGVPRGDQWHRQLLHDMALDVPQVRPAVITAELSDRLGEFLRFRHVFRNVYGSVLQAERMAPLEAGLDDVLDQFLTQVQSFCSWMVGEDENLP